MNFRVGDKVRRINYPWGNVVVGGEYYVVEVKEHDIVLKGDDHGYDKRYFILVSKEERVRKLLSKI